ncbi:MAG TPA: four helix bundle protein [Acidobacteriaceae bacterium]
MTTAVSGQRSALRKSTPLPGAVKSYRELTVWQRSIELTVALYRMTRAFPREEVFGLTSQLRRASVSIVSNIAEGYGRGSKGEYRNFLGMARGSALEVQTQLVIARERELCDPEAIANAERLADETGKVLWAMMQKL